MQGFHDAQARHTDTAIDGHDADDSRLNTDRRGHPDRRKRERRNSKASKSSSSAVLQPILTQAEIAALLRGTH